jgi:hypothetical protein
MVLREQTRYTLDVAYPPEHVVNALVDFSGRRRTIWPETSHPSVYRVHAITATTADVTEGLPFSWSREHYDWSEPGRVLLRQVDSNMASPGGTIEYRITATATGSRVECRRQRTFIGLRGHLLGSIMVLVGAPILSRQLGNGLRRAWYLAHAAT